MLKIPVKLSRGFTLIELLIVLAIIGTLLSLMSLSIQSRPSTAKAAAEQLQQLFILARDESILKGKVFAWKLTNTDYSFYGYQNKNWLLLQDSLLKSYPLSAEFDYQLTVNSVLQQFKPNDLPQVLFLPDGSVTQFNMVILPKDRSQAYAISIIQGKIKVVLSKN